MSPWRAPSSRSRCQVRPRPSTDAKVSESQMTPGATRDAMSAPFQNASDESTVRRSAKKPARGDDLTGRSLDGDVLLGDERSSARIHCHRASRSKIDHVLLDLIFVARYLRDGGDDLSNVLSKDRFMNDVEAAKRSSKKKTTAGDRRCDHLQRRLRRSQNRSRSLLRVARHRRIGAPMKSLALASDGFTT